MFNRGLTSAFAIALALAALPLFAEPPASRQREIALIRRRLVQLVDYPVAQKRLESEIKVLEAELDFYRKTASEYEKHWPSVSEAQLSNPMWLSLERSRLQLRVISAKLEALRAERDILQRYAPLEARMRLLEDQEAGR